MVQLCEWAVVHWVRFPACRTTESLDLSRRPEAAVSWKFGPDEDPATRSRLGSAVWCGIGLFGELASAQEAFRDPAAYLPDLHDASEAWHALLQPFACSGECNHLNANEPGPLFAARSKDPGGPLFAMTTAGFNLRTKADLQRLIDFRRRVDSMREIVAAAAGNLGHQVFAPHTPGDDGVTMSLWRDEQAMLSFAYRPGPHRVELDRQRSGRTVDRSSFTRFRILDSAGLWGGIDPLGRCQPESSNLQRRQRSIANNE